MFRHRTSTLFSHTLSGTLSWIAGQLSTIYAEFTQTIEMTVKRHHVITRGFLGNLINRCTQHIMGMNDLLVQLESLEETCHGPYRPAAALVSLKKIAKGQITTIETYQAAITAHLNSRALVVDNSANEKALVFIELDTRLDRVQTASV